MHVSTWRVLLPPNPHASDPARPLSPEPDDPIGPIFHHDIVYHIEKVSSLVQLYNATSRQNQLEAELSGHMFSAAEEEELEELELELELQRLLGENRGLERSNKIQAESVARELRAVQRSTVDVYLAFWFPGVEFDVDGLVREGWTPVGMRDEEVWESLVMFVR